VTLTASTLSGNSSTGEGGGIFTAVGVLDLTESTLSNNRGTGGGGGIYNDSGTLSAAGTIVADSSAGADCAGFQNVTDDAGYNLADDGSCGFTGPHSMSDTDPYLGPLNNNGGPTATQAPALGSPALDQIPLGTTGNGVTLCPGTDQRGVARPQGPECDIGAVELVVPRDITSTNNATATAGSPFSFTVDTSGNPVPVITEIGALPKHLTFTDNHNGTATLSGTPKTAGVTRLTIKATFGKGTTKYVVRQAFTLTVDSG
jgi:hypothetical protein